MKEMRLLKLTLRNFQGIRNFTLETHGGNVTVYGANGTGKTTLFNAFLWLLFGKDSHNRTDLEIKELDSTGHVRQHKLEYEVEGVLSFEGRSRTFRRVLKEKWTKKRGSVTESFEGHTTAYYVDGVPVSNTEYDAEVASLIPEDLFKLLTSPTYFNEHVKWQDKRKLLVEVCGDVTDAEVIHSNRELAPLEKILRERDIEKHKSVIVERMKRINQEIKDIPVRISEAERSMPDLPEESERIYRASIGERQDIVTAKQEELARVRAGGQTAELQKRIAEIDNEQFQIKSDLQTKALEKVAIQSEAVNALQREVDSLKREMENKLCIIEKNERLIEEGEKERAALRLEFAQVNDQPFVIEHSEESCPACGQSLPEEQIKAAHDKAEANFNRQKAERLELIKKRGHAAKAECERLAAENERLSAEFARLKTELANTENELKSAEEALELLRGEIKDPAHDERYIKLQEERTSLAKQIDALQADQSEAIANIKQEIASLQAEIAGFQVELAKFDQVKRQQQRIAELEAEEKRLASEYERLQHELFLTEEFARTKVNLLQDRIDSKFKLARFRLFEEQVNGGLKECCETMYNGVPYSKGLNNAARINVGLDIINTLAEHYGFTAPIIVDNAESVTQIIETRGQLISLVVSEEDKQLRVEALTQDQVKEAV
jgi:DNA repair exonuclease SbcCD ATPase subunit